MVAQPITKLWFVLLHIVRKNNKIALEFLAQQKILLIVYYNVTKLNFKWAILLEMFM